MLNIAYSRAVGVTLLTIVMFGAGCSTQGSNPTGPHVAPELTSCDGDVHPTHILWGIREVRFDPVALIVELDGNKAYVSDGYGGLQIIDVDPIESAYIHSFVDTPEEAMDAFIFGNMAYVAALEGGLRVIELW